MCSAAGDKLLSPARVKDPAKDVSGLEEGRQECQVGSFPKKLNRRGLTLPAGAHFVIFTLQLIHSFPKRLHEVFALWFLSCAAVKTAPEF